MEQNERVRKKNFQQKNFPIGLMTNLQILFPRVAPIHEAGGQQLLIQDMYVGCCSN